jgi:CRP-like cAMP-binding protein
MIVQREDMRDVMIRYQGTLSAQGQRMAACNALHSVEERLARWLLQMSDRIEGAEIPVTQDTLAHLLGVRRTTVTLVAHNLQVKGVIRYRRGHVAIASRAELLALSCECYDACKQADELVQQADLVLKASA